jgi:hypothetical protein
VAAKDWMRRCFGGVTGATLRNGCHAVVESEQHTQGPSDGRAGPGDWHRAAQRAAGTRRG